MQQKALQQRHSVCSVFLRYVLLFMFVPRGLLSHNLSTASALTKTNLPAVAKNSASVAACQLYYLGHTALQWENINVPIYFTVGIKPLQLHRTTTGGSGSQRWRCISIPEFVNVLNLAIKELFFFLLLLLPPLSKPVLWRCRQTVLHRFTTTFKNRLQRFEAFFFGSDWREYE